MIPSRDTYFTLFYHIVFSTKERRAYLIPQVLVRLLPYITSFCKKSGTTPMIVNGVDDHVHLLLYVNSPSFSLSDFIRELKKSTNKFCNSRLGYNGRFGWQTGYFAQSISRERVQGCLEYIKNQQIHHKGMSFAREWEMLLADYAKDYNFVEEMISKRHTDS